MNTAIIYGRHDSITEKPFSKKLNTVSQLFCQNDGLTLISINEDGDFKKVFNKATKNNDIVFLTPSVFYENSRVFQKKLETELFGFSKRSFFSCLPDDDGEFFGIVAKIISSLFGEDDCYAFDYIDITEMSYDTVCETVADECLFSNPHLFVLDRENSVRVLVVSEASEQDEADRVCVETEANLKMLFGDNAFSNHFHGITTTVVELLSQYHLKVATAESCTAGMLSSAITSVPGSSEVFEIGISSYADRIKTAALGVSSNTIKRFGAVSMQTALEMAHGIKTLSDSDLGISATGVAGPTCSEAKPVGTVYIALTDGKNNWVIDLNLESDLSRDEIRKKTTYSCLDLLRRYLTYYPDIMPYGTEISKSPMLLYELPHIENEFNNFKVIIDEFDEIETEVDTDIPQTDDTEVLSENTEIEEIPKVSLTAKFKEFILNTHTSTLIFFKDKARVKKFSANAFFTVLVSLFVIGSITAYSFFNLSNANKNLLNELVSNWNFSGAKDSNDEFTDFKSLNRINADISAWLNIGDGALNLPVCSSDNDYYKNHNYKRKLSSYGAIYSNTAIQSYTKNIILYGNSPIDGSMFACLKNYKSLDFLKNNYKINLTLKDDIKTYQIFAVMIIDQNDMKGFTYSGTNFSNTKMVKNWIDEIRIRSLYNYNSHIPETSDFITLVTDTNEFDGAKLIIVGFSASDNNNYGSIIKVNPSPYYPDIWYEKHGLENPYADAKPIPDEFLSDSESSQNTTSISEPDAETIPEEDDKDTPPTNDKTTEDNQ